MGLDLLWDAVELHLRERAVQQLRIGLVRDDQRLVLAEVRLVPVGQARECTGSQYERKFIRQKRMSWAAGIPESANGKQDSMISRWFACLECGETRGIWLRDGCLYILFSTPSSVS